MKKLLFIIGAVFIGGVLYIGMFNPQPYAFIPNDLRENKDSKINANTALYYIDGTIANYAETIERINTAQATVQVYGDAQYGVVKVKETDYQILYPNIPKNLKYLGVSFGNPNSDVVVLNAPGGPVPSLKVNDIYQKFLKKGGLDYNSIFGVTMHQSQTLETTKYANEILSFEQAKKESAKTTRIMRDLTQYFKSQGKTVYVLGISFGAFAIAESLHVDGNIADKYIAMVGRLDMTPAIWKAFANGDLVTFAKDCITPTKGKLAHGLSIQRQNMSKMAAAFGHKRYTQLLAQVDMSNVIYIHGTHDQEVGCLTNAEISFLKSRGATVIQETGGHNVYLNHLKLQKFIDKK